MKLQPNNQSSYRKNTGKQNLKIPKDLEKEIRDAFDLYDVEKKGYIGRVEMRNVMGNFGFNQMNAREIEDVLKNYDQLLGLDYKPNYNYETLMEILTKQWNHQNGRVAEWEQIFKVFDIKQKFNQRGKESVGPNEIKRIFDEYLEEKYIEDEDILEYIKEFDKDGDGIYYNTRIFKQR